jgi:hypothetical protein
MNKCVVVVLLLPVIRNPIPLRGGHQSGYLSQFIDEITPPAVRTPVEVQERRD